MQRRKNVSHVDEYLELHGTGHRRGLQLFFSLFFLSFSRSLNHHSHLIESCKTIMIISINDHVAVISYSMFQMITAPRCKVWFCFQLDCKFSASFFSLFSPFKFWFIASNWLKLNLFQLLRFLILKHARL